MIAFGALRMCNVNIYNNIYQKHDSAVLLNLRFVCPVLVAVKEKEDLHPDTESQEMNDETFYEYR